jgi:hypothetical protein
VISTQQPTTRAFYDVTRVFRQKVTQRRHADKSLQNTNKILYKGVSRDGASSSPPLIKSFADIHDDVNLRLSTGLFHQPQSL